MGYSLFLRVTKGFSPFVRGQNIVKTFPSVVFQQRKDKLISKEKFLFLCFILPVLFVILIGGSVHSVKKSAQRRKGGAFYFST